MRANRILIACLWIGVGGLVCSAQTVTETKMLADFEDGTGGIFGKVDAIAKSDKLTGNSWTIKKGAANNVMNPKVDFLKYDLLRMDVFNPSDKPVRLHLCIVDDDAPHGYFSWINRYASIRPGKSMIEFYIPALKRGEGSPKDSLDPRPFHWDKVTRFGFATEAEALEIDNLRLEKIDFPRDENVRAFDFGPVGSAAILGMTAVTDKSVYDDKAGFGWRAGSQLRAEHRSRPLDSLVSDWISSPNATFSVKLPNGKYHVWLMWEDQGMWEFVQNYTQRSVSANGKAVIEEKMDGKEFLDRYFHFAQTEDMPGDDMYAKYIQWRYQPREFDVEVADGKLDLNFRGSGPYAATANGLVVYPADKAEAGKKFLDALAAWRKHEFQVNWSEQVADAAKPLDGELAKKYAAQGFIVFRRPMDQNVDLHQSAVPGDEMAEGQSISMTAARGEQESARVCVQALQEQAAVKVSLSALKSDKGVLPADAMRIEMVRQKFKCIGFGGAGLYGSVPWLLVPQDQCVIPKFATRSFFVTAAVPADQAEGVYKGTLTIEAGGKSQAIELSVRVLPLTLPAADMGLGMFGIGDSAPHSAYFPENEARNKADRQQSSAYAAQLGMTHINVTGPSFAGFKDGHAKFDFTASKAAYDAAAKQGFTFIDLEGGFGGGSANAMAKQIAEDKGDLAKKNGFASTDEMAKVFFGDLAEQAKAAGLPVPIFSFGDEPPDTVAPKMIELHKRVKDAGGRCTVCWSPAGEPTHQLLDVTTVCSLNVAKIADIERAVKAGNEIYLNNQGVNRWAYGLYMWKAHQAGVKAYQQFIWMGMHADPYFPLDSIEDDLSMVYPDRDGRLRPIVNLLRIREGIDDYRYTLALTQAILKASGGDDAHKKLATEAKAYLEGVIGKIAFEDTRKDRNPQMTQAQLDDYRAKVQEFLLKLDAK